MRDDFNREAEAFFDPDARVVTIPAHTVTDIDWGSVSDDARSGKLKDYTTADIRQEYGTPRAVDPQAYAFISWDKVSRDMPDETRDLLKQALEDADRRTPGPLKGRIALHHPLRLKKT